jgi:hypothetical protein
MPRCVTGDLGLRSRSIMNFQFFPGKCGAISVVALAWTIKPLTDVEHWRVVDRWSYPDDGYGDCEDYVLLKRRMLMQSGWPPQTLLVTVVHNEKDEGHALLMVATDSGDYVLDNQNMNILLRSETGYRFVKRQSQSDPNVWGLARQSAPHTSHGDLSLNTRRRCF